MRAALLASRAASAAALLRCACRFANMYSAPAVAAAANKRLAKNTVVEEPLSRLAPLPAPRPAVELTESSFGDGDGESDPVRVFGSSGSGVASAVLVGKTVRVLVGESVLGGLGVALGDAPFEREGVGERVPVCVAVPVDERVAVGLAVSVDVLVIEIGVVEPDGELLGDAPGERGGVPDALTVDDELVVEEPVSDPEGVPLRVAVPVPVALPV